MDRTGQRRISGLSARLAPRVPSVVVVAAAVFVAWHAFRLAYAGSQSAAVDMGVPVDKAGSYPWCIEGVVIVASTATLTLRAGERALAWTVLALSTGVSCAANVLHAISATGHHVWSPGFAVVPPLALPACVRLAERVAVSILHRPLIVAGPVDAAVASSRGAGPATPDAGAADPRGGASPTPDLAVSPGRAVDASAETDQSFREASVPPAPDRPADPRPDGPDAGLDESTGHSSSGPADTGPDTAPDVRSRPRRTSGGRRTGQSAGHRNGRPAGHSPDRPLPDWRTSDWSAVAQANGIRSRSRAYTIMSADPGAVQTARQQLAAASAPLNGQAP